MSNRHRNHSVLRGRGIGFASAAVVSLLLFNACTSTDSGPDADANADGIATTDVDDDASADSGPDDTTEAKADAAKDTATTDTQEEKDVDDGPTSGPCNFWLQECGNPTNCYPSSGAYSCLRATGDGQDADPCVEDTDCGAGLLCTENGCAVGCSIDELIPPPVVICIDDCPFGFDTVDLDMQLGICLPDTTPGEFHQILPDNISKEHVFKGLWMDSIDDMHLVGADGIGVHYEDGFWNIVTDKFWPNMNAVWGFAPDDAWAVGLGGLILHYDGFSWKEPGGCTSDGDCDDADPCTIDTCAPDSGKCQYQSTGEPGCCGGTAYTEGWDGIGLAGWTVEDLYADPQGGILWQSASIVGSDGVPRFTSAPNALYFGDPNAPCVAGAPPPCPSYDTGGIVGATATSPLITLPASGIVKARFQAWIATEDFLGYDIFGLNVVANGLAFPVWERSTVHSNFVEYEAELSLWAGQTVQLQFIFDSVDANFNETEGVYVDDFQVVSECDANQIIESDIPTLFDIWGASPDSVYAAGLNGTVIHYDGSAWKPVDFGASVGPWNLRGLIGFSDQVIAVGEDGLILKSEDGVISKQPSGVTAELLSVWGSASDEVYAVGGQGTVLFNDGSGWTQEAVGVATDLKGVWGAGSFQVIAVGTAGTVVRREDGLWTPEDPGVTLNLNDVWALGSKNVWAVGDQGTIIHHDGDAWTATSSPEVNNLSAVSGASSDDIWAVGANGAIVHYDGASWTDAAPIITQDWYDVWATGESGSAIVVGDKGLIIIGDGTTWNQMLNPMIPYPVLTVWGSAPDNVYAAGDGFILHYDGNETLEWKVAASVINLATWRGVCGSGDDHVLIVGAQASVLRWDGKNWGMVPVEPEPPSEPDGDPVPLTNLLYGCWTTDVDHAWAVGEAGIVLEYTEGRFVKADNRIPVSLRKVFALTNDLIIAAGIEGIILASRGVGKLWQPIYSGSVAGLFDIHGTTLEDITIVGDLGTILRFIPFYEKLGIQAVDEVEESGEEDAGSTDEDAG